MATKVTGQLLGGAPKTFEDVHRVRDVYEKLGLSGNYTATVNGEPADMSTEIEDYTFVSFTEAVKGGI
jgi:hypothetical protein